MTIDVGDTSELRLPGEAATTATTTATTTAAAAAAANVLETLEKPKNTIKVNGQEIDLGKVRMELTCNPISLGALYYVTFNVKEAIEYLRLLDGKTIKQPTKEKMTRDNAMSEYGKNMATTEQLKAIFVLKKVLAFLGKNPLDLVSCWYRPNDNSGDGLMNMEFGSILKIPENSLGCVVCVYD